MEEKEKPQEKTYKVEEWCGGIRVTDIGLGFVYYGPKDPKYDPETKGVGGWVLLAEEKSPFDEDTTLTPEAGQQLSDIVRAAFPATASALESPKS